MAKWQVMCDATVCMGVEADTQEEAEAKANTAQASMDDVTIGEIYLVVNLDTGKECYK